MAISLVTPVSTVTAPSATTITASPPSGTAVGDVLVAVVSFRQTDAGGGPPAVSGATGWTMLQKATGAGTGTDGLGYMSVSVWVHPVATSGDIPGATTWTNPSPATAGRASVIMARVTGADTANPVAVQGQGWSYTVGASTTFTPATASADQLRLIVFADGVASETVSQVVQVTQGVSVDGTAMVAGGGAQSQTWIAHSTDPTSTSPITVGSDTATKVVASSFVLAPAPVAPPPASPGQVSYPVKLADGSPTGTTARMVVIKGDTVVQLGSSSELRKGALSAAAMMSAKPFFIAHHGGSVDWPEETAQAYTNCAEYGYNGVAGSRTLQALEMSLAATSDGVLFGLHDQTLDRVCSTVNGQNWDPRNHTWAEVQQLQVTLNGPAPFLRLEDYVSQFARHYVTFLDFKYVPGYYQKALDLWAGIGALDRLVWKSYGGGGDGGTAVQAFKAAGCKTWGYFYENDIASNQLATWGPSWDWLGMDYGASDQAWATVTGMGKPVIGHICPDSASIDRALSRGAVGCMVSGVKAALTSSRIPLK